MSGPANKKRPSTHHLEAAEAKLPQKVHPKVPPTGAAKMRSTQAVPRSLGGAPARSTARPHPHPRQACGIQAETCTRGQQSCLLCHTPSEGRLTNKSQPARSKQVQPAQPARHKTSPQHSKRKSKSNCWRPCAPRQFLFKGRKVLVSFFWKNHSTKMNSSSLSSSHECHRCLASYSQIPNT